MFGSHCYSCPKHSLHSNKLSVLQYHPTYPIKLLTFICGETVFFFLKRNRDLEEEFFYWHLYCLGDRTQLHRVAAQGAQRQLQEPDHPLIVLHTYSSQLRPKKGQQRVRRKSKRYQFFFSMSKEYAFPGTSASSKTGRKFYFYIEKFGVYNKSGFKIYFRQIPPSTHPS